MLGRIYHKGIRLWTREKKFFFNAFHLNRTEYMFKISQKEEKIGFNNLGRIHVVPWPPTKLSSTCTKLGLFKSENCSKLKLSYASCFYQILHQKSVLNARGNGLNNAWSWCQLWPLYLKNTMAQIWPWTPAGSLLNTKSASSLYQIRCHLETRVSSLSCVRHMACSISWEGGSQGNQANGQVGQWVSNFFFFLHILGGRVYQFLYVCLEF